MKKSFAPIDHLQPHYFAKGAQAFRDGEPCLIPGGIMLLKHQNYWIAGWEHAQKERALEKAVKK